MPLQRTHTQANVLSPRPPPPPQRIPIPERRPDPPQKSVKVNKQFNKRYSPVKLHPKKLNRLGLTQIINNPSITSTRKHTYRPKIRGGIGILNDLSKVPQLIPSAARKVNCVNKGSPNVTSAGAPVSLIDAHED
ncbi:hypothetical protein DFH28DRAFT_1143935 [Melampsora americana]|nr:hypothetical protein DFH28DRAFT_1177571 [Melampsora americana]KAH9824889.1 hypothetical protein DFH28DRAFT_1143935 [Melampsora americana]